MLFLLFMLLSVPIGGFCAWFAYRAFRIGRRETGMTFSVLALACLLAAGAGGGWLLMVFSLR